MSERAHKQQVASVLRRAVQEVIDRDLHDPRVRGLISVTEVRMSADGVEATIMLSIHPPENAELAMHGILHARRFIRAEVAKRVSMRRLPRFSFKEDRSIKRQAAVLDAISDALDRSGIAENAEPDDTSARSDADSPADTARGAYPHGSAEAKRDEPEDSSAQEEPRS